MGTAAPSRFAGGALVVGGATWTAATSLHALRPVGCVGAGCATATMRGTGPLESLLALVGLVLIVAGGAALVSLSRRVTRARRPALAGLVGAVTGAVLLAGAGLAQLTDAGRNADFMPLVVGPGVLALVLGCVLLAVAVVRAHLLPRWATASLIVATLLLVGANEQTRTAWLAVPFGLAWAMVGAVLTGGFSPLRDRPAA